MRDLIVAKVGPPPLPGFAATVDERPLEKAKGIDPWAQARSDAAGSGAAGTTAPQEPAAGPGGGAAAPLRPPHHKDIEKPKIYNVEASSWLQWAKYFKRFVERNDDRWPLLLDEVEKLKGQPIVEDMDANEKVEVPVE